MKITGMVWLPIQIGRVRSLQKFYVASELCNELILGEDWLEGHRAQLKFGPATVIVGGVEVPLYDSSNDSLLVVTELDIKLLPLRTAISCGSRTATKGNLESYTK